MDCRTTKSVITDSNDHNTFKKYPEQGSDCPGTEALDIYLGVVSARPQPQPALAGGKAAGGPPVPSNRACIPGVCCPVEVTGGGGGGGGAQVAMDCA